MALEAKVPTISGTREYVEAGSLISYGANLTDLFRRAGDIVDKILRGAKPGDLPVQQPTKFDLIVNLKTAKALGIDIVGATDRPRRRGDRMMGRREIALRCSFCWQSPSCRGQPKRNRMGAHRGSA